MTIKKRRQREIEEMRELILLAASSIISEEGVDNLSIRKIAKKIEYSPSIIYHYFNNKEEILNKVLKRGYKKIVSAVSSVELQNTSPEEKLVEMTKNYIMTALKMPDEFMAAQLSKSEEALKHTSYLFKGAAKEKPALSSLYQCLLNIDKEIDEDTLELTSQMIATSTLGIIIKLIVEKDIGDEQKKRLIDFYSEDIVLRTVKGSKIKGD